MSEKRIAAEALRIKLITECRFIQGVNSRYRVKMNVTALVKKLVSPESLHVSGGNL